VKIYDRFGKLLVELDGAESEGWDGTYQGKKMPSTDYWYVITIGELDKLYSGHFTLMRGN
jgi:gliding motility-associated-like protein